MIKYRRNSLIYGVTIVTGIIVLISLIIAGNVSTFADKTYIKNIFSNGYNKILNSEIKGYSENGHFYNIQYIIDKSGFKKAPDFAQITGYINTEPIKLADLNGKVILVHFWTFDCINCKHTIPYLNNWYQKYAGKNFTIIGVHSPELGFEKNIDNVKTAVQKYGIKYPVLQDNNFGTWNAYGNQYWPRDYLIDTQGFIRYDHIGEGDYAKTENTIQSLLSEGT